MNQQKSEALPLSPGFVLKETAAGLGQALSRFLGRMLGKSAPAERAPLNVAIPKSSMAGQRLPDEISCETEQQAVDLCKEMIACGYMAQVHFNAYDYAWSVGISAAMDTEQDIPQAHADK
ncbi:hypothetical protein OU994_07930 [Pseudoduganella sp. SL102]|uniref:hypothetical protein n=1 Tax=Pseudoduganella sp. SL102 TaxID=2995154 RepID=UPI00248C9607|nr:hypothetical protein [Pseudoduganella sp. SL102]WBS04202.1 hypothetical protein OU994_07930 [Pseudoduganella sp. SL102]